jgi:LysR family transcriptional regulator, glycine cleavage system transcriptional activator
MPLVLPPLGSLRHFEAAARLESFKEAAKELNLTPGAVSQQVAELERFLNASLFDRLPRQLSLTEDGKRLAETVTRLLTEISFVATEIAGHSHRDAIRVEVGPFFSARWLAPRLTNFIRKHPDINVHLLHTMGRRLDESEVDISIRWGDGHWPRFKAEKLLEVDLQPVSSPKTAAILGASGDISSASDLLIHTQDRSAWSHWLLCASLSPEIARGGTVLDEPNVAVEAVVAGRGIGIGYFPLMDEELRSGRLVCLFASRIRSSNAYFLLTSPSACRLPVVQLFSDWLRSEAHSDELKRNS